MVSSGIAGHLQSAIENEAFGQVPALAAEYGRAVAEQFHAAKTLDDKTSILEQARGFLQDQLSLTRVVRSHIAAQLATAARHASYQSVPLIDSTWCIDG